MDCGSGASPSPASKCSWCGADVHVGVCPRVAAIEYSETGQIVRVEFHRLPEIGPVEDDDKFRARLLNIVGYASVNTAKIKNASGRELDNIAASYEEKRRGT
jgi:hypothetical protein